jgi:ribonuclease P protein component
MAAKKNTLRKNERVKSRKLIGQLFQKGKRFTVASIRVICLKGTGEETGLRFGAGVSSKIFKKAVDRNRIKRLLRETWRVQKNPLKEQLQKEKQLLIVFIQYTGKELPAYPQISEAMQQVIIKLMKMIKTGS